MVWSALMVGLGAWQERRFEKNTNPSSFMVKDGAADTIAYVNQVRKSYNLKPLIENPILDKVARIKACDMRDRKYFDHLDPDGNMIWPTIRKADYNYLFAGENIAMGTVGDNETMQSLLNSPEHRDNILSSNYTEIGVANCGSYYTQIFATPK